ncbi:Outer membrane receptor proteins, mostly Fe transport [Bryocella elongata]|uniref:Outer membrane receptor proteins, mostly Fe transport n=1 Tax=Bryocella elongata TaxID=863522 RepID=A0A1H6C8U0_9BACT|nr:TonB-dependent receptor [Bryocella elongata]SEG69045.1 Outer membrane receptor proteins, mostly Fe transport [Bryocella elongata]
MTFNFKILLLRRWRAFACLTALFVLIQPHGGAQSSSANITGTIEDTSNAVVPNATVTLVNQETNVQVTTKSLANGQFIFPDVQPGKFTVIVMASGFKELRKVGLVLLASEPLDAGTLKLAVGDVKEQVTVQADITPLQTTSAERSAVLDNAQMENLLVIGRDPMGLTRLNPGVVGGGGSSSLSTTSTPTVNGVNSQYNFVSVDGVPGNTRGGNTFDTPPNMDAVQEVTMLESSYSAANGKVAGANFNFVTKSGTQHFHGGAYYYFRNEDLNANSYFNKFNGSNQARARYRYNTFGGTLGGPVFWPGKFNRAKDKLFFFVSIENAPITSPDGVKYFRMPTAAELAGDYSHTYQQGQTTDKLLYIRNPAASGTCSSTTGGAACFANNQIPSGSINSQGLALMQILYNNTIGANPGNYIADNPALTTNNYNYTTNHSSDKSYNQQIVRIDYFPTEKLHMFGRYNHAIINNLGYASTTNKFTWLFPLNYQLVEPNYAGNVTYTITQNLVNELNVGFSGWLENSKYVASDIAKVQLGASNFNLPSLYSGVNPLNLFPNVNYGMTNGPTYGWDSRFPFADVVHNLAASDGLTWVKSSHTFKYGVDFEQDSYLQPNHNRVGTFDFSVNTSNPNDTNFAYSNSELGNLNTYTQVTKLLNYDPVTTVLDFYAQDTWKLNRKLVLDYGIRWSYAFSQSLAVGNNFVPSLYSASAAPALYSYTPTGGAVVDPTTGNPAAYAAYAGLMVPGTGNLNNGLLFANTPGYPSGTTYNQGLFWQPRFGFAYSVDDKTVIRGHYGIFYNARSGSGQEGDLTNNAPSTNSPKQYYTSINSSASNYYANAGTLSGPFSIGHALPLHMPLPYTEEGSLGVQHQFPFGMVADVAYVGTFTRHASRYLPINEVPYNSEFSHYYTTGTGSATKWNSVPDNFFRAYAGFDSISMQQDDLTANYNSLQARLTRRFHNGLEFGVNYTYSRTMDYGTCASTGCSDAYNFTSALYQNLRAWNYGPASYDIKHNLAINYLWTLPKGSHLWNNFATRAVLDGWQISGDMTYLSGAPAQVGLSVTGSPNITGGGDGARVALTCDPMHGAPHTFNQWFNTNCFATPVAGSLPTATNSSPTPYTVPTGTMSPKVNIFLPGDTNFDTALFRNVPIGDRGLALQLRVETYNTFNHSEFNAVNATALFNAATTSGALQSNNLGRMSGTANPRYMQLALRLNF